MIFADLHCHSTCSDGSTTPVGLIDLARKTGLLGLSITDHDTIDAYAMAIPAAAQAGILLGTGVEFSCQFQQFNLHLLGYDFNLKSSAIIELCHRHQKRREVRNLAILQKLKENNMPLTYQEVLLKAQGKTVGRPHIAAAMLEKGYVKSLREAFNLYLADGKKCYAQGDAFTAEEAIDVIHSARGKAFIAHPQLLPEEFPVDDLLKLSWDGIECHYARLFQKSWLEIAEANQWLVSGGSDYHGSIKPETILGSNGVDETTFHAIFEHSV